jgi:hypothetical protein
MPCPAAYHHDRQVGQRRQRQAGQVGAVAAYSWKGLIEAGADAVDRELGVLG